MAARVQAGLTAASLPFVAGLAFLESNCLAAAIAFVVAGVMAVLTFANRLPLLNLLPLVGAPRVSATFDHVDPATIDPSQNFLPNNGVFLQIALEVSTRMDDAVLSFLAPENIEFWNADGNGNPTDKGRLMLPSDEPLNPGLRSAHWSDHAELRRGPGLMLFVLIVNEPGSFKVRAKVDSERLYRPVEVDYEVVVR